MFDRSDTRFRCRDAGSGVPAVRCDDSANAFAMPGGKIGVNTGLLELVDSDDELAAVIGHEICHVLYKHSHQRYSAKILRGIGGVAAVVAANQTDMTDEQKAATLAVYGVGTQVGLMLPFRSLARNRGRWSRHPRRSSSGLRSSRCSHLLGKNGS